MIYDLLKDTGKMIMTISNTFRFNILNTGDYKQSFIDSDLYNFFEKATETDEFILKKIIHT